MSFVDDVEVIVKTRQTVSSSFVGEAATGILNRIDVGACGAVGSASAVGAPGMMDVY